MKKTIRLITISTLMNSLILTSLSASAQQSAETLHSYQVNPMYQPLDEIHQLVTNHVKQKIDQKIFEPKIQIRKLSSTLKLPFCNKPLLLNDRNPNTTTGRMTISISCESPKWRVFVPVVVDGKLPVVMSVKGILKLAVIEPEDIQQILLPYKKVPKGSMVNIATAIGMRTTKAIPPNKVLKIRDLQPPFWVFKDQQVNLITRIGSIEVKVKGLALQSGVEQEQVPVKNLSSDKVVKGIVIAPNTVLVP